MRVPVLASLAVGLVSSAFAQQMPSPAELGNKLVREVCVQGAAYQLTSAEAQVFSSFYVYGMMQVDGQTERWFYSDQPNKTKPYCLERSTSTSPATCRAGEVGVASHGPTSAMLGMNQTYYASPERCW